MNSEKTMPAIFEVVTKNNWWNTLPDKIKADVEAAVAESEKGKVIPHAEIQKKYKKWIVK